MTDDLKQRLRAVCETGCDPDLPFEAADRIEQLEAERDKHRKQVHLGFKHLMETPVLTDAEIEEGYTAFEHMRRTLAKALDERDELKAAIENFLCAWDSCRSSGEWPVRRLEELRAATAKGEKNA